MKIGKTAAIVLAAGKGTRMESDVHKQYLLIDGHPLIYYALEAFEKSAIADEVILVTGAGEVEYCRMAIVDRYGFSKVTHIVEGGMERYHSVFEGLKVLTDCAYVLIHDGARPCVTEEIIEAAHTGAIYYDACVVGMPVKDTIKIADDHEFAKQTPDRRELWTIQTPQAFSYELIFHAYEALLSSGEYRNGVTDDAMVVEAMTDTKVKLIRGDYSNIKVTTPEDLSVAEVLLKRFRQ